MAVRKKTVLKEAKDRLEQMKLDVLSEIRQDLREGREGAPDEGRDAYDVASDERERELSLLLSNRDRSKLQAIDDALERIDDGTYFTCENCEGDIHPERLLAMPFTRLCVQCQSDLEKEESQMRRNDEAAGLRRVGTLEFDEGEGS